MLKLIKLQQHLAALLMINMSSLDDESSEISSLGEEASSLASCYSSSQSSSGGGRSSYQRGYRDAQRDDYRQIPRRRRW